MRTSNLFRVCTVLFLKLRSLSSPPPPKKDGIKNIDSNFPMYNIKILLGDFNAEVERENISKPTNGNDGMPHDSNDNGVRIINFGTSKNLVVKSTIFPHRNIHKYTWTSPDGQTHTRLITY